MRLWIFIVLISMGAVRGPSAVASSSSPVEGECVVHLLPVKRTTYSNEEFLAFLTYTAQARKVSVEQIESAISLIRDSQSLPANRYSHDPFNGRTNVLSVEKAVSILTKFAKRSEMTNSLLNRVTDVLIYHLKSDHSDLALQKRELLEAVIEHPDAGTLAVVGLLIAIKAPDLIPHAEGLIVKMLEKMQLDEIGLREIAEKTAQIFAANPEARGRILESVANHPNATVDTLNEVARMLEYAKVRSEQSDISLLSLVMTKLNRSGLVPIGEVYSKPEQIINHALVALETMVRDQMTGQIQFAIRQILESPYATSRTILRLAEIAVAGKQVDVARELVVKLRAIKSSDRVINKRLASARKALERLAPKRPSYLKVVK